MGLAISPSSYMDSNNGFYTHELELLNCTKAFSIHTSPGFSDLKSIYQYYHSLHLCKNQSPHFINEENILTNYSSLSKLVNELLYKENMNPEGMCFSWTFWTLRIDDDFWKDSFFTCEFHRCCSFIVSLLLFWCTDDSTLFLLRVGRPSSHCEWIIQPNTNNSKNGLWNSFCYWELRTDRLLYSENESFVLKQIPLVWYFFLCSDPVN